VARGQGHDRPGDENGFIMIFAKKRPFSDEDLAKIEKAMRSNYRAQTAFHAIVMPRAEAITLFKKNEGRL